MPFSNFRTATNRNLLALTLEDVSSTPSF